ncbi:MAG: hypothetical protein JW991_02130 [Candidatus Pacebacteria bacterium]|nr:hypothetical protein [Candidatus Paceibacterota bacterium]
MKDNKQSRGDSFRVGDKIVDLGKVFRIFKVEKRKTIEGKEERAIYFRPYFKTTQSDDLICSIPIKNINLTQIRKPMSKKRLEKLLKKVFEDESPEKPVNTNQIKEKLKSNKLEIAVRVLKKLWLDKQDESTNFSATKRDLLNLVMKRLEEEAALALDIPVSRAREEIKKRLEKLSPSTFLPAAAGR